MANGILRERVFGCDLGERLALVGREIPLVLEMCSAVIEEYGIVDGIYRLSGILSNLQRLRLVQLSVPSNCRFCFPVNFRLALIIAPSLA